MNVKRWLDDVTSRACATLQGDQVSRAQVGEVARLILEDLVGLPLVEVMATFQDVRRRKRSRKLRT